MTTDEILTESELAERWKISVSTLQKNRGKGAGVAYMVIGPTTVRYRLSDVLEYEQSRVTGGYIAPRARAMLSRAAAFLVVVGSWKLGAQTREMVNALAVELALMADENNSSKKPVDINKVPGNNDH